MVNTMKKNNQPIYGIDQFKNKCWYLNGQFHREDGPAVESAGGTKAWYFHGQYHRLDGPAVEYSDGTKEWYYHGEYINCSSQEEFERLINLKVLW